LLTPKDSIDARQYAAAFVTQCTLSLNGGEGSWSGLCQCGSLVMFCAPNAKNLTGVPKYPKSSTLRKIRFVIVGSPSHHGWREGKETFCLSFLHPYIVHRHAAGLRVLWRDGTHSCGFAGCRCSGAWLHVDSPNSSWSDAAHR